MKYPDDFINQVICGDCLEVMKQMPDKCVDLVLTDPPYGIDYQSAWRIDKNTWKPKILNDKKPFIEWIGQASRILKDTGALVSFYRWDVQEDFKKEIEKNLTIKSQIVWDKVMHGMGDLKQEYGSQHELAFFATKGSYVFPGKRPKTVYRQTRVFAETMKHPNEKPVALMEKIIIDLTEKNQTILDCFFGSGSSLFACQNLHRNFIGIEISPEYCEIAKQRLRQKPLL